MRLKLTDRPSLKDEELPELLKWVAAWDSHEDRVARGVVLGVAVRDRKGWRDVNFSRGFSLLVYTHPNPDADPRTVVVWSLKQELEIFPTYDTAFAVLTHTQEI